MCSPAYLLGDRGGVVLGSTHEPVVGAAPECSLAARRHAFGGSSQCAGRSWAAWSWSGAQLQRGALGGGGQPRFKPDMDGPAACRPNLLGQLQGCPASQRARICNVSAIACHCAAAQGAVRHLCGGGGPRRRRPADRPRARAHHRERWQQCRQQCLRRRGWRGGACPAGGGPQ